MADDPTPDAWMCLACSYAENSLDCLRCSQRRRHDGDVPTTMAAATARWAVARWDTMTTTMATDDNDDNDDDDDDDGNGATGDGIQRQWRQRWRRTTTTMRSMATVQQATMMATLVIII